MPRRKKTEYASYCGSGASEPPNDRGRLFVGSRMRTKYATAVYAAVSAFALILLPAVAAPPIDHTVEFR